MLRSSISYSPRLRREQIMATTKHLDNHDDADDVADFQAARREDSLAVEALDALGFATGRPPRANTGKQQQCNKLPPIPEEPLSPVTPQKELHNMEEINRAEMKKTDMFSCTGMICRHRSEMPTNSNSFSDSSLALLSRSESLVRKAGVFEFPCDPGMALSDLCVILAIRYSAFTVAEDDFEIQTKINIGTKRITIVVKVEDRRYCSRLSLSPTLADAMLIGDEDFDAFCTELFISLLNIRQVIRPYYK